MKSTRTLLEKWGRAEAQRGGDYACPTHVQRRSERNETREESDRKTDRPKEKEKTTRAAIGLAVAETAY